ncbi:MAG: NADH-quinone oxidoreductase subunit NuoE [Deltaproteobacteria bacterium]|nr:NADH-quinone oxidoreductase subunit NuoE [Deltaproteobacteria bacterium]
MKMEKINGVNRDIKVEADLRLSDAAEARIEDLMHRYPCSNSALLPALYIAQEECSWLTDRAIRWVASRLNLPLAHVLEVATFYTMFYKQPVGKYHIQICRTLSCMLCGAKKLTEQVRKRLNLSAGEVSGDGMWSFEEVECLGSCGTAPMVEINDTFFENLTPEKLNDLLNKIEKFKPDLRYSGILEELGKGLEGFPKSSVW